MEIRPIRTEADHDAALAEIERLFHAEPGTDDGDKAEILVALVEAYERRIYPMPHVAPLDSDAAGVEQMNIRDNARTITAARAIVPPSLHLSWSDGAEGDVDLGAILADRAFTALREPSEFARVEVGDWGHSLAWPSGVELSADMLWLEMLSATGRSDTRAFLEWRLRHALSLSKAAEALGVSRRMVADYSNGEKKVPKPILLACGGWEVGNRPA